MTKARASTVFSPHLCPLRVAIAVIFGVWSVWASCFSSAADDAPLKERATVAEKPVEEVQVLVTDREDNAIEGALVTKLNWLQNADAEVAEPIFSNNEGVFRFPKPVEGDDSGYVMIYKPDYAVGAVNLAVMPAQVRLHRMKPVAVRIVGPDGEPVRGAEVSVGEVHFQDEFLQSNIAPTIREQTKVTTRDDGWAILRCTRPEFLESVNVKTSEYGTQTFASEFDERRFSVLQLHPTTSGVAKLEHSSGDVKGWKIIGTKINYDEGFHEKESDTAEGTDHLLPVSVEQIGEFDGDGEAVLPHLLLDRESYFIVVDAERNLRSGLTSKGTLGENTLVANVKPLASESGRVFFGYVREEKSEKPLEGVEVSLHMQDRIGLKPISVTSDQEGRFEAKLCEGTWQINLVHAPQHHYKPRGMAAWFVINDQSGPQLDDFTLSPGRLLKGKIEGVKLALHRARWIQVYFDESKDYQNSAFGKYDPEGNFEVTVPVGETPAAFQIVSREGYDGSLEILSANPFRLGPTVAENDAQ